jgi:TPR repeat protein
METINTFLTAHKLVDYEQSTYSPEDIDAIVRVINGDFANVEQNKHALDYAGWCVSKKLHLDIATKTAVEYFELSSKMGCKNATIALGTHHYNTENYLNAIFYFEQIEQHTAIQLCMLALSYHKQQYFIKCNNTLQKLLLKHEENDLDATFYVGNFYYKTDNYPKAEQYLLPLHNKGNIKATDFLASGLFRCKQYNDAIRYYLEMYERECDTLSSITMVGRCYEEMGDWKEGIKYYLIAHNNGHIVATYNLGCSHYHNKNYEEAELYLLEAYNKGYIGACWRLGDLYVKQHKIETAKKYLLHGHQKGNVESMLRLGKIHYNANELDIAEQYYLEALLQQKFEAYYWLGCICEKQQKYKCAEKYFVLANEKNINGSSDKLKAMKKKNVLNVEKMSLPIQIIFPKVENTKECATSTNMPIVTETSLQNIKNKTNDTPTCPIFTNLVKHFTKPKENDEDEYELLPNKPHEE